MLSGFKFKLAIGIYNIKGAIAICERKIVAMIYFSYFTSELLNNSGCELTIIKTKAIGRIVPMVNRFNLVSTAESRLNIVEPSLSQDFGWLP